MCAKKSVVSPERNESFLAEQKQTIALIPEGTHPMWSHRATKITKMLSALEPFKHKGELGCVYQLHPGFGEVQKGELVFSANLLRLPSGRLSCQAGR